MEELRKEFVIINEYLKKNRMNEISENTITEIMSDLDEDIKIAISKIDKETEDVSKKLKFAIRNLLNSHYEIRQYVAKERILELREIIAQEYLK